MTWTGIRAIARPGMGALGLSLVIGVVATTAWAARPQGDASYAGHGQGWHGSMQTSGDGGSFSDGAFHMKMHCSNGGSVKFTWDPTHTASGKHEPIAISSKGTFHSSRSGHQSAKESGGSRVGPLDVSETIAGHFSSRTQIRGTYKTYVDYLKYGITCHRTIVFRLSG